MSDEFTKAYFPDCISSRFTVEGRKVTCSRISCNLAVNCASTFKQKIFVLLFCGHRIRTLDLEMP